MGIGINESGHVEAYSQNIEIETVMSTKQCSCF